MGRRDSPLKTGDTVGTQPGLPLPCSIPHPAFLGIQGLMTTRNAIRFLLWQRQTACEKPTSLSRKMQHCLSSASEKLSHLRLHVFIHFNQRWPRAFETFAGKFLRRVNAEFAAAGDFAGGV